MTFRYHRKSLFSCLQSFAKRNKKLFTNRGSLCIILSCVIHYATDLVHKAINRFWCGINDKSKQC